MVQRSWVRASVSSKLNGWSSNVCLNRNGDHWLVHIYVFMCADVCWCCCWGGITAVIVTKCPLLFRVVSVCIIRSLYRSNVICLHKCGHLSPGQGNHIHLSLIGGPCRTISSYIYIWSPLIPYGMRFHTVAFDPICNIDFGPHSVAFDTNWQYRPELPFVP